uniref:aldehyde dehydrogenase family protein n=1 Tax=Blastomonas sp. TaxID=1909299 RepID=UPI00359476AF
MGIISRDVADIAARLGLAIPRGDLPVTSPIDAAVIASFACASVADVAEAAARAQSAFICWCNVPAPRRGELVRRLAEALRAHKADLGLLVTIDCGKPISEGLGEVQEMIDICDFAVGLSRQLYGLTIASERPGHRMSETWHPLGPVAIITAFNFPVAVWAWNAALALVCGDPVIWKPSEKTPLTALAVQALFDQVCADFGCDAPPHLAQLLLGDAQTGAALVDHPGVAMISATGSTRMGRIVGQAAAGRFARVLLELGGNNASIVSASADMDLTLHGCAFGFMGTSGQRCTSLRRLFVERCAYNAFVPRLISAASRLPTGDPRDPKHLAGPLIDEAAFGAMQTAL